MKTLFLRASLLLILAVLVCCGKKADSDEADEWPEMDSFHMVMADAFHPYKDSANLAPAKKLAEELALEADRWQGSKLPRRVDNDAMKGQLEKLKAGTRVLADRVKAGAPDDEIGSSLTALHDNFHAISEAWYGGGEKHEHH